MIGEDFDLLQRLAKCVAVIGIAGEAAHAEDEALIKAGGDADLAAELIAYPRLAFGDAVHFGRVQGIDPVTALCRLMQQLRDQRQFGGETPAQISLGDVLQVTAQVPHHPASITFEPLQGFTHAFELFGMGIAAHL